MKNHITLKTIHCVLGLLFIFGAAVNPAFAKTENKAQKMTVNEFRSQYAKACQSITGVSENIRAKYCDCMTVKYVKRGYTDKETLENLKKAYKKTLPPGDKMSDFQKLLFSFDATAAEECLEEVSH